MTTVMNNGTSYSVGKVYQNWVAYTLWWIWEHIIQNIGYIEASSAARLWSKEYWGTAYYGWTNNGTGWKWLAFKEWGYWESGSDYLNRAYGALFYVGGKYYVLPINIWFKAIPRPLGGTSNLLQYGKLSDTEYWIVDWFQETSIWDKTYNVYKVDTSTDIVTFTQESTEPTFIERATATWENILTATKTLSIVAWDYTMSSQLHTRWGSTNDPWAMYAYMRLTPVT